MERENGLIKHNSIREGIKSYNEKEEKERRKEWSLTNGIGRKNGDRERNMREQAALDGEEERYRMDNRKKKRMKKKKNRN